MRNADCGLNGNGCTGCKRRVVSRGAPCTTRRATQPVAHNGFDYDYDDDNDDEYECEGERKGDTMLVIVYREKDGEIAAVERVNEAHARGQVGRSLGELLPLWEKEGLRAIALPDEVHPVVHRVERSPAGLAVVERHRKNEQGPEVSRPERPWYLDLREALREERERERRGAARTAAVMGDAFWGDLTSRSAQGFRRCISDCLLRGRAYERPPITRKVSVIVPCFNMGRFLGTAIESVLGNGREGSGFGVQGSGTARTDSISNSQHSMSNDQGNGDGNGNGSTGCKQPVAHNDKSAIRDPKSAIEVIVVAQGCTDESAEVARRYAAKDKRVRVVEVPLNLGAAFARNWGILHAQGEWYGFLDADDAYEPGAIREMVAAGERAKGSGFGVQGSETTEKRTSNIQHSTSNGEGNGENPYCGVRTAECGLNGTEDGNGYRGCKRPRADAGGRFLVSGSGFRVEEGEAPKPETRNQELGTFVVVHGRSRAWDVGMKRALYEEPWRGEVTAARLREQCCFVPGCMLAHESVFWKTGVWWAEFWQRIEDYEWQAAALGRVRFFYLDKIVLRKRETAEARAKWPVQSEWSRELRNLLQGWMRR